MSKNLYILPHDSLIMVTGVYAGLGALFSAVFVVLTILKSKSAVCKPSGKEDLDKLNAIEGLELIKEDSGDYSQGGGRGGDKPKPKKKGKKEV
ncbi:hypothetical protein L3Y34_001919 [Caenorhabditis briggsae]|uniref:Uncharacterized protein n=2 Tax=Caenorhabditis briggsae TaxID=6238 RepID=A0AAE9DE25_CAEBR|nr:hypothetical protein L3Y34_001919 [Caenorhabditis briggsae]